MSVTSFFLIDRANKSNKVTVDEEKTVGEMMDTFFTDRHYTLQMLTQNDVFTIDRTEKMKNVLKKGIIERGEVKYRLINTQEFIDVYINTFTQHILGKYDSKCRIYCTDETTVQDIEVDLNYIYKKDNELGLYGYIESNDEGVFKLKSNDHVLFMKRCFSETNFFQYQFNNCIEAVNKLEVTYEGKFYRLDYAEQKIIFKTTHRYALRGTTLVKMKGYNIADTFYDINDVSISMQKYFAKNILVIKNHQKIWLLCTLSENICHEMYQALLSCKSNNNMRKVDMVEKKTNKQAKGEEHTDKHTGLDLTERLLREMKTKNSAKPTKVLEKNGSKPRQEKTYKMPKEPEKSKSHHKVDGKKEFMHEPERKIGKREKVALKKAETSLKNSRDISFFQKFFSPTGKPKSQKNK